MSYRKINSTAFSSDSTWVNLGLWTRPGLSFKEANEELATTLGKSLFVESPKNDEGPRTLVDAGCGNGDSIALWINSPEFSNRFSNIIGINVNEQEFSQCLARFKSDVKVQMFLGDANIVFPKLNVHNSEKLMVVCIDAIYHFGPSRMSFFETLANDPRVVRIAMSDIVLSSKWARELGKMDFLTEAFRQMFLSFISVAAGVPRVNLSHTLRDVEDELTQLNFRLVQQSQVVTDLVFQPFSDYCLSNNLSWFSIEKWTLISSGYFMRLLKWSQAVDFVLYSAQKM